MPTKLWIAGEVQVEMGKDSTQKVKLVNPSDLERVKETDLVHRLLSSFSKYEIEEWVTKKLLCLSHDATSNGLDSVDLTKLSNCKFKVHYPYEPNKYWEFTSDRFKRAFIHLRIFEILSETEEEIILKYKV